MVLRCLVDACKVEWVSERIFRDARILIVNLKGDVNVLAIVAPIRDIVRIYIKIKMLGVVLYV